MCYIVNCVANMLCCQSSVPFTVPHGHRFCMEPISWRFCTPECLRHDYQAHSHTEVHPRDSQHRTALNQRYPVYFNFISLFKLILSKRFQNSVPPSKPSKIESLLQAKNKYISIFFFTQLWNKIIFLNSDSFNLPPRPYVEHSMFQQNYFFMGAFSTQIGRLYL